MDRGVRQEKTLGAEVDLSREALSNSSKEGHIQALANMNLDLTTLEGQLKFTLINQRTNELIHRYSSPQFLERYSAFLVSVIGRDELARATPLINNDVISILLQGMAMQSAIGEYRTASEATSALAKAIQDREELIALGGEDCVAAKNRLKDMMEAWLRDHPILQFNSRVFDKLYT